MKKKIAFSLLLFCSLVFALYAQDIELKFNKDGKFKIVQFTDIHFVYGHPNSDISIARINEVLDVEKPNLVVLTGDIVVDTLAEKGLRSVLDLVEGRQIPFVYCLGNHDDEIDLTRQELFDVARTYVYNITASDPKLSGVGNCILPIESSNDNSIEALLYCFDSHSYSKIKGVRGYDYIKSDQIDWYRKNSKEYTINNGDAPIPSLAFFHIPLQEYNQAASDERAILIGTRGEKACAPELNSGLFTAMKEQGDIMGVFVGHDHDNDYAVSWKGIVLAYGRFTGSDNTYNNLSNGARVIELTQGDRSFNTWIHLKDNEIINMAKYPNDFIRK